ncbi:hypothetical protein O0L34_g16426 [Tuta absoluta]|nr:hypothetical protein O0L34_g16426 [Tuta absoluta]
MQSGARPMDVSANTPTASKNSKTTSKACVAPCGHSLVIKKEINTHDSTKVKKPSNNSKVPISIKSTVQTWRGVLKSRDREIASIELIQSKQTNTNPQKETEEKETRSKKLDNRNVRTDNCQRVHIDNIGPNFTGKTNNELKGSLASAKPIPDLATMLKKISVLNNWLTNSADDYLTTTSANTEVSFQICDKMNKKEPKTVEDIDNPTSSAKDEVVVASSSSSAKVNKTENSVFLHKSRTNANPTKDICKSPEEKSACRLNNEMFNSIRNESGYSSMNPVKVKTSNISENTIVKGPCPSFIIKQDSNLVSDEESKTSETLECISAMTVLLQPTVICNDLKYKLENKNENTSPAANQEIATGDSFTVNGVSKSYQFPSQDVNHDDCICRIPPSYVDCESEVLQKTTNLESVVFDSSIHNSVSFPTNEAEVMDQLSHFNMLDACPGDEKSFLDDESECHCTTTSSFSHSGPIFANCISGDMTDTWEYRFFDAAGTVAHDHVKNSYAMESSDKSYFRRCGCIHNSTNTRFYMPFGEADYLRHKRNRRICSRHMRCCFHSRQVSLIVQLANQCRRKWNSAIKKTLHRWMVFRKTRFKNCAISLIQRSMLLQDVDVQTQILYFRDTGTVMMKDQKSMAMMTSLRLHSWLASYNKLHTDSQMRRIHKNIKNIQQEYTSRGPFMFPMANTKQFLQFCATTQQIRAAVDGCPGYPLRVFHSSPARHSPRSITCGKQTDEIVQKEVWTMMDYFNQDITTETEDLTFAKAPGCAGFRVHPLKTCCWMDDKECERFNNKSVLDTGYFTVQNIITSPCATGNLRTNFDSKTGLYKPFMSFDGRCCQNVDFSKKISLNVAAKPNFTSSIKSFLKNIRRPNSPVRKGSVSNCTTDSGVGRKNSQSTQMSYFLSPSSKSAAISTSEINCRRSIGCTTTSPDVANMTVLTLGNTEVGHIFFNVLKQENASQYSQLNLTEPPKPKLKSTAVNTATEECQNAADIFIISKIKKGTRFEAAKISCKNNNAIYTSNRSPGTSEAVSKRTKNATTGPYLVEKVSEALSAIDISSSMIQKCAQVQYSQQSFRDVNMKQVTSVGVMTSTDGKPQFSCHKSKANATVQCSSYPMRKHSSQRSTNIGRSQLMSVFTLCSSNKEVATQYSKSCERLFYEEPHLNDDPKGAAGVVSQKSSVTTSTEDTTKPTVLQAARGENYAFNYPPSMHDGLPQSKPRSLYKALSSDTYSPRNRASFRSSSFDDKREPILDPQLICLSNLNNKDDSTFEAVSSSLNAVKWIRRCGLPLGLPIDNEAYKEEQKELLDHFRKAMQKGSPQSSNSPQVTIEETQAFHQAPLDQLKALLTTMIPRYAPVPPVFNTDSMEVTPPCSQILGKSFTKTEARNKENSREFQLQVKSGNKDKKYSKEFQLQAKPDSCDAATDCIPICSMLEMRNTKSASAITSRIVLPPCSCRDRCAKYDECLFVYDSPKCVTHNRSHTDASLQIYPSSRNVELETSKEHAVDEYIGSNTSITATSYTCCQNIQKDMPPDLLTQRLSNPVELHQFIHENTPREYTVRQNSVYNDPSIEVLRKALELSPKMLKALYETSKLLACSNWSDAAVSTDDGLTYNLSTQMCCPEQLSAGVLTSRFFGNENFNSQETSLTTTTTPTTQLTTPPVKLSCRNTFTQPSCKMAIDGITQCSHSKYSTKALDAYPPEGVEIGCGSTKECSTTDEMHGWCCNMLNHRIGRVKDCLMKQLARHIKDREINDKNLLVMDNTMHSRQPGSRISCLRSEPSCNIMSVRSSLDIGGEDKKDLSHAYNTLSAIEGRIRRLRRNLPD